jgi:hypothetical protein
VWLLCAILCYKLAVTMQFYNYRSRKVSWRQNISLSCFFMLCQIMSFAENISICACVPYILRYDHASNFHEEYELWSSLFLQLFPHSSILLRFTCTHNHSMCSTVNVVDQDLHTHTHRVICHIFRGFVVLCIESILFSSLLWWQWNVSYNYWCEILMLFMCNTSGHVYFI